MRILSCCFLLSNEGFLCRRLLSQLNEMEREYQELLKNSVQRKQTQIDALKKADTGAGDADKISKEKKKYCENVFYHLFLFLSRYSNYR